LEYRADITMKMSAGSSNSNKNSNRNGNNNNNAVSQKNDNKKFAKEIKSLVLWASPMKTLKYASLEVIYLLQTNLSRLLHRRAQLTALLIVICSTAVAIYTPGQHQILVQYLKHKGIFVRYEAFLWGAGTALGELPPYFMAKAARLSGNNTEELENLQELEKLQKRKEKGEKLNLFDKGKLMMEDIVERVGFFGILLCASIPNPLFDLAGITCGHFLVPFWKFFGATLIGKAVIKMHIQKIFVIISFNESLVDKFIDILALIPMVGVRLQKPFKGFFETQKQRLHRNSHKQSINSSDGNLLASLFEYFVFAMICYFLTSIVNTFAQSYCKRMRKLQDSNYSLHAASNKKQT
uniref:Transmembrane protein 49 n=1 Tax=Anopheles coluzzii TaxID=1518534 RepID=A0A8W7NZ03_ANOCL